MGYLIYDLGLLLYIIIILPGILLASLRTGKYRRGLRQRLGFLPPELIAACRKKGCLWIHAVSVGEVAAIRPLVKSLKTQHPEIYLLISTVTETGQNLARQTLTEADQIIYFPLDFSPIASRVVHKLKPRLFVMAETEIWPNTLRYLAKAGVPAIIINGRISERSFRGYKFVRPLLARVLNQIAAFSMQSEMDAGRIRNLGAPPERVRVSGNLKFDCFPSSMTTRDGNTQTIRHSLDIEDQSPLWVAGSTHPGEEEIILSAYHGLRREYPNLVLILAPRHIERSPGLEELLQERGLKYSRRSQGPSPPTPVILLDTIGELAGIYSVATIVFVGGSLVPKGGHNLLEPAVWGKPVLFGPYMNNFPEITRLVLGVGAGIQVADGAALLREARSLLANPERCREMGSAGKRMVEENRGATKRTLELIWKFWSVGKP